MASASIPNPATGKREIVPLDDWPARTSVSQFIDQGYIKGTTGRQENVMSDINSNAGNAIFALGNIPAGTKERWEREMRRASRKAAMEIAVKLPEDHSRALAILADAASFHAELSSDAPQDDDARE